MLVVWGHEEVRVVVRAPHGVAVVADDLPGLPAVLRSPDLAPIGFLTVPRCPVTRLDEGVDAVRVRSRDRHLYLPHLAHRQAVALLPLPRGPAVVAHEQPAARPAALPPPRLDVNLPHPRKQLARVGRIHRERRAARVLVDEEHVLPARAAVRRPKHAALRLRAVGVPQCAREHHLRVGRMHHHPADPARLLEPHPRPRLARVHGLEDPFADRDVAPDARLTRARPHDARVGRRNRQRPDRGDRLIVEDRLPVDAGVGGLDNAARGGARVVDQRVTRHTGHRTHAVAGGADVPPAQLAVDIGVDPRGLLRETRHQRHGRADQHRSRTPHD